MLSIVGLGSNLGDYLLNLRTAVCHISTFLAFNKLFPLYLEQWIVCEEEALLAYEKIYDRNKPCIDDSSYILQDCFVSSVYQSPAMLPESAPEKWNVPFLNMAVSFNIDIQPLALIKALKNIEKIIGRQFGVPRWSPRLIDIDILVMGDSVVQETTLKIPHIGFLERDFALIPAAEIHPDFLHPITKKTLSEHVKILSDKNGNKLTKIML